MDFEFKKLSDVNIVETINSGSRVLMEDGGEIVKVDASKVGGSGGGTVYLNILEVDEALTNIEAACFADEALTQPLTYEEGKKLFMAGAGAYGVISMGTDTAPATLIPSVFVWGFPLPNVAVGYFLSPSGGPGQILFAFSDSDLGTA